MALTHFLKNLLSGIVDAYKNYFLKSFGAALVFTVLSFAAIGILVRYSAVDPVKGGNPLSLLSYFFERYSGHQTYAQADNAKSVFLFFVSLFSIGLARISGNENKPEAAGEWSLLSFIKNISWKDVLVLILIVLVCAAADWG